MANKIHLTDAQVAGYAQAAGITRNVLCVLPKSAQADQPPVLTEPQQAALVAALRPKCLTRAEVLLHNDGLLMLLCAGRGESAALIGREEARNILVPVGANDLTATVLAYLLEDGAPNSTAASMRINGDSFLLLLAIADTYRRRYLDGLLRHEVSEASLTLDELSKTIEDAYSESDTRWLFPFVLMALEYPVIEDMQAALDGLYRSGMLNANGLVLTPDGERFAQELMYLQTAVHIETRRVRGNTLLREDVLLLRTRESLWCAVVGKEETTLFTLSAEKMYELVSAICAELDEPREDIALLHTAPNTPATLPPVASWQCSCGSVNAGAFCPKCGTQRDAVPAALTDASWQCACGRVNQGAFCPKCGSRRDAVPVAPTDAGWQCACGRVNQGAFCPQCGMKRAAVPAVPDDARWRCACGRTNKGAFCPQCGAERQ